MSSSLEDSEGTPDETDKDTPDDSDSEDEETPEESSDDDDDDDDSTPTPEFEELGECRFEAEGLYKDGKYEGFIDYILIADEGDGEDLCRVRFEVKTVEDSKRECKEPDCYWATVVELSNPEVILDVEGKCANSDRQLGDEQIKDRLNKPMDFGVGEEPTGHGLIILSYNQDSMLWEQFCDTEWEKETGVVLYDDIEGRCFY